MAKINPIQTNFTAGELSDRLMGRVDIARYQNGAKQIVNCVPLVEGGLMRRDGLRQIAATKDLNGTRLMSYVYNKDEAYVIEVGAGYARFYNSSGQVVSGSTPVEVSTSFAASELFDIEYVQGTDSMLLAHQSHMIQRLYRISSTEWLIGDAPFDPLPFGENGRRPATAATLSAVSGTITVTLGAALFMASDVGRNITAGPGVAEITAVSSATSATATVKAQFATTSLAANSWKIAGSPQAAICALTKSPVGSIPDVYAMGKRQEIYSMSLDSSILTIQTTEPHGLSVGQFINLSFFESDGIDGNYHVREISPDDNTRFNVSYTGSLLASAAFGYLYAFDKGEVFSASDVGSYIRMNDGLLKIESFVSASHVTAKIIKTLSESTTAEGSAWSLESTLWNSVDGYPASVALFQQRLIAAGSPNFPQTMWGSSTGTLYEYTIATDSDDAFQFAASSDQVSPIRHLVTAGVMGAFSDGVEFTVDVGSNNTIGPTDAPNVKAQSTYGCADVRPLRVGGEIVYVQRGGRKVRALSYDLASDNYISTDLTALAQHITEGGLVDCAFQQEPTPVLWFVRDDGVLVSVTYDKQQNVTAWARHTTSGKFLSVACIPSATADEGDLVFVVVERTINGATSRFVERFDADLNTDCAVTGTATTATETWTGLSTLEGATVDVKADGVYMGQYTVASGQIVLPRTATSIEIGLHYDNSVTLLPPAVNGATGTNIGSAQSTSHVILRVNDTIGGNVNGDLIPWREFGTGILNQAPQPFTGDKDISTLGWDKGSDLVIAQTEPYDWHLLAVIRTYTTNQG